MTPELLVNLVLFVPALGALLLLFAPKGLAKTGALIVSLIPFVLSLVLYAQYRAIPADAFQNGYALYFEHSWIAGYDISYILGIDGISIYLVLLTTLLFPISIWFSFGSVSENEKAYYLLLLLLETGVMGVFLSLDVFLFYVFFEVGLIPMYFLIGLWGGKERVYAALKFFLYTLFGSLLMLIAILWLGNYAGDVVNNGVFTTSLQKVLAALEMQPLPLGTESLLFWAFALSFLIKVPAFPVHTWLPAAHVQAPTAGSVILAGILLKMGTYALIRFNLPLFPAASMEYTSVMAFLGLVGIIYGAMAAMVQTDIKKLVAYSSVAHMGFILMGIFSFQAEAVSGAVLQMINHGISTGALFLIVGMIYDRRHTREIADFQGIATQMPVFTFFFMLATLSSIGLPGLNGFVGEFLILLGSFASTAFSNVYAVLGATGVIIAAVYMLWMFRRVMFGPLDKEPNKQLKDLNMREVLVLMPLVILMFWIGLYATPFLAEIGTSSDVLVEALNNKLTTTVSTLGR